MKPAAVRARDAAALLATWRQRQGHKAARGIIEVLRALENTARPLCQVAAYADEPAAVILTHDQLRIARQRAVSQERMRAHGALPRDGEQWWSQIAAIQHAWSIDIPREAWTQDVPKKEAA